MFVYNLILFSGMELLFEGIDRETPSQQGAVGHNSLPVVNKGYAVDSSRSIEAEYRIDILITQSLAELRPV